MNELFLDLIERCPSGAPAVSDTTESVTYDELLTDAGRVAALIAERHQSPGYVIVKATPTVRFVTTLLGVMYSGSTPVPVDPELPQPALDFIRAKSGAIDILHPVERSALDRVAPVQRSRTDAAALVMFTSGTTGFPKGVLISHANLLASCRAIADYLDYRQYPSAAVGLPLHYSYALLSQVLCQLHLGGRVHLFNDMRNPLKFARTVNNLALQTFCGVPTDLRCPHDLPQIEPARNANGACTLLGRRRDRLITLSPRQGDISQRIVFQQLWNDGGNAAYCILSGRRSPVFRGDVRPPDGGCRGQVGESRYARARSGAASPVSLWFVARM